MPRCHRGLPAVFGGLLLIASPALGGTLIEARLKALVAAIDGDPGWTATYRNLGYDFATDTATLSDLALAGTEGGESVGIRIGAITVRGFAERGRRIRADLISAERIEFAGGAFAVSVDDVRMEGIDTPYFADYFEQPSEELFGYAKGGYATPIRRFAIGRTSLVEASIGGPHEVMGGLAVEYGEFSRGVPHKVVFDIAGITIPPPLLSLAGAESLLGYDRLVFHLHAAGTFRDGAEDFETSYLGENIGRITFSGRTLGETGFFLFPDLLPIIPGAILRPLPGARFEAPPSFDSSPGAVAPPGTMDLFEEQRQRILALKLVSLSLRFDNLGIVQRVIDRIARDQGVSHEQTVEVMKGALTLPLFGFEDEALVERSTKAVGAFLDDPRSIAILAKPSEPVSVTRIIEAEPRSLPALLGIDVVANQ